jgi:hypothetical protein
MMVMCEPTFLVVNLNIFIFLGCTFCIIFHFFNIFYILVIYYFERHTLQIKVCNVVCYCVYRKIHL